MNTPAVEDANQTEVDFGLERQGEVEQALRYLLGNGANKKFDGCFDTRFKPSLEALDRDYIGRGYAKALKAFAAAEGAEVGTWTRAEDGLFYVPGTDCQGVLGPDPETVVIGARVPPKLKQTRAEIECRAIEAVAETMRVVLVSAISAAVEDAKKGEKVRVMFTEEPRFLAQAADPKTGFSSIGGEFKVNIFTEFEPRVSYILGAAVGSAPMRLQYILPLVELYYGQNRLRWMDRRAPDSQRTVVAGIR